MTRSFSPPRPWRLASLLAAGALAAPTLSANETVVPGFELTRQFNPAGAAVTCTLPGGAFVTFDGLSVDRWSASGGFVAHLGSLPSFVFASFLEPTPDGTAVVLGDSGNGGSTTGDLHLAQLDGSGLTTFVSVPFNYDGAFLPNGDLIVSAAQGGFGTGNDLVLVDLSPPSATTIGHVDGFSGPLAVARNGDVYYGTQPSTFPPPPGAYDIVRWSYGLVQSGTPLTLANAAPVASGFNGASSLAFDPFRGRLYLAENDFFAATSYVRRVKTSLANSPAIVSSDTYIGSIRFQDLGGAGSFDAFQPGDGLSLVYETSDFVALNDLVTIAPRRPTLAVSGPGTTGVGPVTLEVTGGAPNGSALLTYCPQPALLPGEVTYPLPKFLLHTTFVLAHTSRFPFLVPTDANGRGTVVLWNPGSLKGMFGFQFHVGLANGVLIGSSNVVDF